MRKKNKKKNEKIRKYGGGRERKEGKKTFLKTKNSFFATFSPTITDRIT